MNNCRQMKDKIAELLSGTLSEADRQLVDEHLAQCSECSKYLESLHAEDKLLDDFVESLDRDMDDRRNSAIHAAERIAQAGNAAPKYAARVVVMKFAAAVLLITAGFLAGRILPPRPDIEKLHGELLASLEPVISARLAAEIAEQRHQDLAAVHANIDDQLKDYLNDFTVRMLEASSASTNQLITELIYSIREVRAEDHQAIAAALEQIESNRITDKYQLAGGLQTLALYTEDGLKRTQQGVALLAQALPADNLPHNFNNPANSNERSEE